MATIINISDRQGKRRTGSDRTAVPDGGARIILFTGVRYERYQPETQPRPTGTTRARKR